MRQDPGRKVLWANRSEFPRLVFLEKVNSQPQQKLSCSCCIIASCQRLDLLARDKEGIDR